MIITSKVILTLTPDERRTLDHAQDTLANIVRLIENNNQERELFDLYEAADGAYAAIGEIYKYVEEDYT